MDFQTQLEQDSSGPPTLTHTY